MSLYTSTYLDTTHTLGNIFIKHNDKWRGDYYLKEDLTFGVNRGDAARFYLLKAGDTTILNGDRISLHMGSRTLITTSIDGIETARLIDRQHANRGLASFIITNGTDNTDPITYESTLFFIADKARKMALKYEWGLDLVDNSIDANSVTMNNQTSSQSAVDYKPQQQPRLTNSTYGGTCGMNIGLFQFSLERADGPITNSEIARNITSSAVMTPANIQTSKTSHSTKSNSDLLDGYKGAILIILLMIVLILCVLLRIQ